MSRSQKTGLALATLLNVVLGFGAAGQQFKSTTVLLTMDVSVFDRDGRPVSDLAVDDFTVRINGVAAPVRTMILASAAGREGQTLNLNRSESAQTKNIARGSVNGLSIGERDPQLLVILVDDSSLYPTDSKGLFVAAERFVTTVPEHDWIGLVSTSGRLNAKPSVDRGPLLEQLRRAFGWMSDPRRESPLFVGFMDALEAEQGSQGALRNMFESACGLTPKLMASMTTAAILSQYKCASDAQRQARSNAVFARANARNQLETYIAVIEAMASAPGVKQLVVLTGGIPLRPADSADFVPIAKAAAAAGVQMSILMEEPDDSDIGNPRAKGYARDQRQMMRQAQALAEVSGGQFFRVIGQADRFYQRVLASASGIYRIGIDLPDEVPPDDEYKVEVSVNRPRVRVLASRYAAPPTPVESRSLEDQIKALVTAGDSRSDVPVQISADVVGADGGGNAIQVRIEIPGDVRGPVRGFFGIVGPDQSLRGGARDPILSPDDLIFRLNLLVPATAGTYELRFAVVDGTGAVGAVAHTVIVR
jgi:VWFA-related protein